MSLSFFWNLQAHPSQRMDLEYEVFSLLIAHHPPFLFKGKQYYKNKGFGH